MSNSKLPEIGSIWDHVDAPGTNWQVESIDRIEQIHEYYVALIRLPDRQALASVHISTFFQEYVTAASTQIPTQWERLIAGDMC